MRKLLSVLAVAALAAGCSSDKAVVGVDPASCTKGSITTGDTKTGTLDASACPTYDWYWFEDSVHYASYNVTVEKGKAYLFSLASTAADSDTTSRALALVDHESVVGDSTDYYLAVQSPWRTASDPAELYFVAPKSGTYSLRAFTGNISETLPYSLTAAACPTKQLDITGAFSDSAATLGADDCTLHQAYFTEHYNGSNWVYNPSHAALYTIYFDGHSRRTITVKSSDFAPGFMVEGPGFDAYCNTYYCSGNVRSNTSMADSVSTTLGMWMPGTYTITVGSVQANATGKYSIDISAPVDNSSPMLIAHDWSALQPGQFKKMKAPR